MAGVFPNDAPYGQYIDVSAIQELHSVVKSGSDLLIGGGVSLSQFATILEGAHDSDQSGFFYGPTVADYLRARVANTNVRNVGSLAGNLVMKHLHNGFGSDIYNILASLGARVSLQMYY